MAESFDKLTEQTMSENARHMADERSNQIMAELLLTELRQASGSTQKEIAKRLGITKQSLSKLEKQSDMKVTVLQSLVEALGGKLEITARFPKDGVAINQFFNKSDLSKYLDAKRELHLI